MQELQTSLNALGFNAGTPDGAFGAGTQAAVKEFQRSRGLKDDGIVGPETMAALQAAQSPAAGGTGPAPAPGQAPGAARPQDAYDPAIQTTGNVANVVKSVTDVVAGTQTRTVTGQIQVGPVGIGSQTRQVVEGLNTRASRAAGVAGTLAGAAQLPGAVYTAQRDVRAALRDPTSANVNTAVGSTASALSTAAGVAKGTLETGAAVSAARQTYSAARTAFQAAAPAATSAAVDAAARAAASTALTQGTVRAAESAATAAVRATATASGEAIRTTMGTASRAAARTALREGGEAAAKAAVSTAAHAAAGPLAKAAGRFAPGLNVAIAVADTAVAVTTLRDPEASTTKKVTSVITAAGSIAAATNIPVVSQVGAAVSTVSGLIGGLFG